ncbi:MAG TPA: hydantoinase B/oxoprolinase family protein [Candidatus Dormibacteraeota bacterium]|nr:hydantoinase B/oxoprolinase family protein [Candidatus Dormibacteraeota bacterium]
MSASKVVDIIEYERGRPPAHPVDPITARVIAGALDNIALEVGHKLTRMSYSSIIRESEDFGVALLDVKGRQIAECSLSTPLQLGPIPGYLRGILRLLEERGERFEEGDVVIHNSPYYGASHEPDVGFCVPIFHRGELVGYSFTTAHHLDVGAMTPGSCGIVDAVDAYAEGLQFRAIKVYERGKRNDAVWRLLRDNIRASDMVVGDMEAQVAACRIGAQRYLELIESYGRETVEAASEELMNYSERMLRQEIERLPDGEYSAIGYIDGFEEDPEKRDLPIVVTVRVEGDTLTVDLTGTAPQVSDRAINMPFVGTVDVAIYVTLRSILLDTATHEYVPQNSGIVRPIRIIAERGSLANPTFPCATIARFCPGNMVADTLMAALAPICPDRVSARIGNMKVVAYSGVANEQYWVYMDITEGAYGGRLGRDGIDAVDVLYANTRNNPIEDIEAHLPLRVTRYELRTDRAGAGKWRGGMGSIRDVCLLGRTHLSLEGDGHRHPPRGLFGGREGAPGEVIYLPAAGGELPLPSKFQSRWAQPGDTLRTVSPCGGGYGDPLERDPERVLDDVIDEFISLESARSLYGVVINPLTLQVDHKATAELRAIMTRADRAGR